MRNRGLWRTAICFTGAFLLCGALRVLTYHKDLFEGFSPLFCGSLLLFWAVSVRTRVTDRRLRRLILGTVAALLLFLVLQLFHGCLIFGRLVLWRYTWYAYYILYITPPLILFFCALAVYRPHEEPLPRWSWAAAFAAAALAICALTNDLHQWMFRFPGGVFQDPELYSPGLLFWLYFLCYGALLLASFIIVLRKAWRIRSGLSFLLPAIPLLLLGVWMVQNLYNAAPAVGGVKLWLESDCFCFAFAAYLELCIQIGLIPANTGYQALFSDLDLGAVILDREETPVYRSGGASWPMPEDPALLVRRQDIRGGSVVWATDLRPVRSLNRQLQDTARDLEQRNAFLREENRMKKERTELEYRTRIYEQISRVLRPQLDRLEALSGAEGDALAANLPELCVLTTYVKRRSNMELLRADGTLPAEELSAALTETVDALRLAGVDTTVGPDAAGTLDAETVISAYEACFSLIMDCLSELRAFYVLVSAYPNLELRLMLRTEDLGRTSIDCFPATAVVPRTHVSIENGDMVIVLTFAEGGHAQ